MMITRRNFMKLSGAAGSCLFLPACDMLRQQNIPPYLKGYEKLYRRDPRAAALQWFVDAKYGLFIHWGLYSLLGRHEWVMYDEAIRVAEYEQLKHRFTAEGFDAGFIADLALEAGMHYITFVCKHCDSFCLWDTNCTAFNSVKSAAGRDFVEEMSKACNERGLGFFAFYEHGFDWRHPHGPSPWDWKSPAVRPHYDPPEVSYKYGEEYDFREYLDYVHCGITELLSNYGPVAGIWLDGIAVPLSGDREKFECDQLYRHIRQLQPQTLISYKYGLTGTEDFLAPEEVQLNREEVDLDNREKPWEICTSLHDGGSTGHKLGWGYVEDARRFTLDENLKKIAYARGKGANILLNIGPLGDGSIHPDDIEMLKAIGKHNKTSV
jgi:alpha-L-fucosidase